MCSLITRIRIADGVCVKRVLFADTVEMDSVQGLSLTDTHVIENSKSTDSLSSTSSIFSDVSEGFVGVVNGKRKVFNESSEGTADVKTSSVNIKRNSNGFDEKKAVENSSLKYRRYVKPRDEIMKIRTQMGAFGRNLMQRVAQAQRTKRDMKIALVFCNSYAGTVNDLGDCAINDGILAHDCLKELGYEVFCFYDEGINDTRKVLTSVLKSPMIEKVCVYFIGHGVRRTDTGTDKDESDGYDECFVFKDGIMRDDEMRRILCTSTPPSMRRKDLILISDSCHSGTIFDIDHADYTKNNIKAISFCACSDSQTAKQDWIERKGNGVFTRYFWKGIVEEKLWGEALMEYVNDRIKCYHQRCCLGGRGELLM